MRVAVVLLVLAAPLLALPALAAGGCAPGNPSALGAHADVVLDGEERWFDATTAEPRAVTVAIAGSALGGTSMLFRLYAWDGATTCTATTHGDVSTAGVSSFTLEPGSWLARFATVDGGDNGEFALVVE